MPRTSRQRLRLAAATLTIGLVAVACGGDTTDPAAAPTPSAPTPDAATDGELVAPTLTPDPFDVSDGASRSDDGVLVDTVDPRAALSPDVAQATEPWPTDWTRRTVELDELILGIPRVDPRDAIPPIDTPRFEPIVDATWLDVREPGALVQLDGEVRFYPLSILTRHEIVNDRFGDVPVAVTYCPLCNTALTFDRRVDGEVLRLGVSGLLRNSDMVIWDDATNSLWQQISGEAIVGELAGTRLDLVSTAIVSYGEAIENFPGALSLSRETGFPITYGTNAYADYSSSTQPFLFDGEPDPRFPALSRVVGASAGGVDRAYPFSVLAEQPAINDELGGEPIVVLWGGDTADALDSRIIAEGATVGTGIAFSRTVDGQDLTFSPTGEDRFVDDETGSVWTLLGRAVEGPLTGASLDPIDHRNEFWFAWAAFFPEGGVYGEA